VVVGVHDPGLREVVAIVSEGRTAIPWEVRIAGRHPGVSVQLLWPELGLSILLPGPFNPNWYDCSFFDQTRERFESWRDLERALEPLPLPSLVELRAIVTWSARPARRMRPSAEERPLAPVVPLRRRLA
jgi:hypothetical protein